ncbi:poly-beta-1,6-N-acetyl-D-glucosamine biosynthesis protein PgaD [Variovorax sp. J2P1-59]|uniref:poly-beta-1,6-N-acetyl-D-glucosamine biosynthesis protein PgaD n=1 Tax=Variovorax flavidus TaxID=3053501 RepID=UPI002577E295|nr:poly-beta-1,6-N-acetyl-D-glucosamine biosynthesis protein PgaD [Variovorax sp. J2P1-59]MDM0073713.1 poly-beta-1,6-N-acetyl-D-glucosamine biosynthesis protein PgaD [Variovorax sp. J2P1-59]
MADQIDKPLPLRLVPPSQWPPRILPAAAPWWMRLRDLVLTLLAWMAFLWLLRGPVVAAVVWLSPSARVYLERWIDVDFAVDLRPYLWVAGGFVVALAFAGVWQRHHLRRQPSADQDVAALQPDAQFAAAGLSASDLSLWREARRLHVLYDGEGRITGASAGPMA